MQKHNKDYFLNLLKSEVVPALGCTEPIAVALAAAKARETLDMEPESIEVLVSPNILKNGMGVGIPGTGMVGLHVAAALGSVGGDPKAYLEVLKNITKEHIEKAKNFVKDEKVLVNAKKDVCKLYVEVTLKAKNRTATVKIKDKHSSIVEVTLDDKVIFQNEEIALDSADCSKPEDFIDHTTVDEIYEFATTVDFEDIKFILEGAKMNMEIAEYGLKNDCGLRVGKTLYKNIQRDILKEDIQNYAMALTAAASDARMSGCMLPVMSNSGSGNQGITVMVPVVATHTRLNLGEEKLARALILSNLIAIHIKSYLGRLSALCGCVVAAAGSSSGIVYLLDGTLEEVKYAIKNMAGNIVGMICDGAKTGCALKVSTGVSAAVMSALLALDHIEISDQDGIIHKDTEITIKNLAEIGTKGMSETDKIILDIMTCK
ncbi:serine dehydratase subunit alpha family protein [Hathewaya histolytica]|uniref:L-cysteine desulfidase family protein n=1 Tax=Hathewaya histolytica TaxID=1498 RepID=UPI003B67645A